jgi:hypothetical protein
MKKLTLVTISLLCSCQAFAAEIPLLRCQDLQSADTGFSVSFESEGRSTRATVSELHFQGSEQRAVLTCSTLSYPTDDTTPEAWLLRCRDQSSADTGLEVILKQHKNTEAHSATVSEVDFTGSSILANLKCK